MNSAQFIDHSHCYLCGESKRSTERELGVEEGELYLRWVKCHQCELVYLDPRPSIHALSALYDSQGYWQGANGYKDYLAEEKWRGKQACDRAQWFVKRLGDPDALRVLEVGSAAGYFLEELANQGVHAQGLDLSRPMVRLTGQSKNSRVSVRQGGVEDVEFPHESFDGLAAWGCDSNFNDPVKAFERFSQWLKPGGHLAFNFHDHTHWGSLLRGRFKLMPNALYFLSRSHVLQILERFGFELLEMNTESCWMNVASVYHHTGHWWLRAISHSGVARLPIRVPVPGSFRVLARKPI